MELAQTIITKYNRLASARTPLDNQWKEAFEYSYPIRGQQFTNNNDAVANATSAKANQAKIYDSTATDACRLLASSLFSGLTPSTSQWFALSVPNVPDSKIPRTVREWLQNGSETLHSMIHSSNYNAQAYEFFIDIAVAGQAGLYVELNQATGGLDFEVWPLATMYCEDSGKKQRIDTVYRTLQMTVGQIVAKFGVDSLPSDLASAYSNNPSCNKNHVVIHAIEPRIVNGKQAKGRMAKALPYRSVWILKSGSHVISEGGYHEFPVIIPRWAVIPGTQYATGPLADAMPDVKTLNQLVKMTLINAEMAVAGTFIAKDDGVINPNTLRIRPNHVVFAADPDNIRPLASGGNFKVADAFIVRLQSQIKRVMMSDELAPAQQSRAMTAEEIRTRTQVIRQLLGPTYSRLQAEFLNPLIERVFGLAYRAGLLGQPPQEIGQFNFVPQYKSPLARAQRMDDITAMDRFEGSLAQSMQALGQQQLLDLYDADKAMQKRAELLGIPVELIREDKEVDEIRRKRSEAEALAQQQQMAADMMDRSGRLSEEQQTQVLGKIL